MYFNDGSVIFFEESDFNGEQLKVNFGQKNVCIMLMGSFCGHCQTAAPVYQQLANQLHGKIVFGAVMIDASDSEGNLGRKLGKMANVNGVPTFLLFKNGKMVAVHDGPRTLDALQRFSTM
jgi:thiol-disulfide isomerase/thioredoxin